MAAVVVIIQAMVLVWLVPAGLSLLSVWSVTGLVISVVRSSILVCGVIWVAPVVSRASAVSGPVQVAALSVPVVRHVFSVVDVVLQNSRM